MCALRGSRRGPRGSHCRAPGWRRRDCAQGHEPKRRVPRPRGCGGTQARAQGCKGRQSNGPQCTELHCRPADCRPRQCRAVQLPLAHKGVCRHAQSRPRLGADLRSTAGTHRELSTAHVGSVGVRSAGPEGRRRRLQCSNRSLGYARLGTSPWPPLHAGVEVATSKCRGAHAVQTSGASCLHQAVPLS